MAPPNPLPITMASKPMVDAPVSRRSLKKAPSPGPLVGGPLPFLDVGIVKLSGEEAAEARQRRGLLRQGARVDDRHRRDQLEEAREAQAEDPGAGHRPGGV